MNKKHGVTGPLSTKETNELDKYKSEIICNYMQNSNFFESLESSKSRERVLGMLNHLVQQFCQGRVHTFGSYRLGVHQKNADIDTLLLAPSNYTHKDFFTTFYKILQDNKNIEDLQKVEDAYVPLIKFKIHNIPIDLLFSRCTLSNIKNINLLDDSLLKNMDEKSILSINGSRVTDMLIDLVPNILVFHGVLRCIKYWAKRRGVYGNSYGYPGGVACAISVARICQFYPKGCVYTVLYKYFELYSSWQWPEPVILTNIIDRNYNLKVWNPKINAHDRFHKMPIITPAYPSMCSTHNISLTTLSVMTIEYKRAFNILKESKQNDKLYDLDANITGNEVNNCDETKQQENNKEIASDQQNKTDKCIADTNKQEQDTFGIFEAIYGDVINKHNSIMQNKSCQANDEQENDAKKKCDNANEHNSMVQNKSCQANDEQENDAKKKCDKVTEKEPTENHTLLRNDNQTNKTTNKQSDAENSGNKTQELDKFSSEFINTLAMLFKPSDFFKTYKIYLKVTINNIPSWVGYIESKIRLLCNKLENLENYQSLVTISAIPFPQSFKKNDEVSFFIALDYNEKVQINIDRSVKSFRQSIDNWDEKTKDMHLKIVVIKKSDVAKFLKMYYKKEEVNEEKRKTNEMIEEETVKKAKVQ